MASNNLAQLAHFAQRLEKQFNEAGVLSLRAALCYDLAEKSLQQLLAVYQDMLLFEDDDQE